MDQLADVYSTLLSGGGGVNEFIVSGEAWSALLPEAVEAVVCMRDCVRAREVHAAFLMTYVRRRSETPLVAYDQRHGFTERS